MVCGLLAQSTTFSLPVLVVPVVGPCVVGLSEHIGIAFQSIRAYRRSKPGWWLIEEEPRTDSSRTSQAVTYTTGQGKLGRVI